METLLKSSKSYCNNNFWNYRTKFCRLRVDSAGAMPAPLYARYVPSKSSKGSGSINPGVTKAPPNEDGKDSRKAQKSLEKKKKKLKEDRKDNSLSVDPKEKSISKKRKRKEVEPDLELETHAENLTKRHGAILAKFQKSSKISEKIREGQPQPADDEGDDREASPELHDLIPLPQPTQPPEPDYKPTFSALPSWLAKPISVRPDQSKSFESLLPKSRLLGNLEKKGFRDAFPVQSALIPLLIPGRERYQGDICVSAATGSGKTLGYVIPLIENLKKKIVTRLRAVIVVPTRELVLQAQRVAEFCAAGTGVKFGTALGSANIEDERHLLVEWGQKFDPESATKMLDTAKERMKTGLDEEDTLFEDIRKLLPDHISEYRSAVDVLICTPGRLVDHIRTTAGFSLSHVEYLIIDEADRLLDESFQQWVEVVLAAVEKIDEDRARTKLFSTTNFLQPTKTTRKIILSATMTRDLSKLATLKLRRPALVAVVGAEENNDQATSGALSARSQTDLNAVDLPSTLREVAIPAGDGTDKPLFLLELLIRLLDASQPLLSTTQIALHGEKQNTSIVTSNAADGSYSDTNSTDTDSSSDGEESNSDSSSPAILNEARRAVESVMPDISNSRLPQQTDEMGSTRILVFTNDNEDAMRLSHLIPAMHPSYSQIVGTLTKASSSAGRKTLSAFKSGKLKVLIASDRASRGLDIPNLTDVISYDMPRSLTSYVHRVGRTARAGNAGRAWTLFINSEARWFWNSIARGDEIRRRGSKVERMKIDSHGFGNKTALYEEALKTLQLAVQGTEI